MERASAGGFLEPFESVGITPPRGRQGHSVPTPRPLLGSKLVHVAGSILDRGDALPAPPTLAPPSFPPKMHPAQFSARRDHSLGGSVSRLDRIRVRNQELIQAMESFAELDEEGGREGEVGAEFTDHNDSESWPNSHRITTPSPRHRRGNDTLDKFTGDSLLHFSFNPGGNFGGDPPLLGGSFVRAFTTGQGLLHKSLNVPSVHHMQSSNDLSSANLFPTAARNPNKAIVTIDAQSSRILMTNEITCELFGFQRGNLVGMKVQSLFTEPYRAKQHALVERNIDAAGKEVLVSGKVMDAVTSYGVEFPVSVWMKKISVSAHSLRVIVVMEPVERTSARFSLDHQMADRQAVTGRTKDNTAFPLTVQFTDVSQNLSLGDLYSPSLSHSLTSGSFPPVTTYTPPHTPPNDHTHLGGAPVNLPETPPLSKSGSEDLNSDCIATVGGETPCFNHDIIISPTKGETPPINEIASPTKLESPPEYINAKVVVYAALSGMVSFLPDGTIHGCNHHFSLMLSGYTQEELLRKDITFLMPDFYNHIGYIDEQGMPLPPLDDDLSFQSVAERSLSPDSAFDYISGRGHVPPSPVRRKNHEVQRSPVRKQNHVGPSPSHHHQPLTPQPVTASTSPRHQVLGRGSAERNVPGGFTGPHGAMPTLIEEEEERERERAEREFGGPSPSGESAEEDHLVGGRTEDSGIKAGKDGVKEVELDEVARETEEEREGEDLRREGGREGEAEGDHQDPVSSTPASKPSDSSLKKSDSFHEFLRSTAAAAAAGGESDRGSVSSMVSLPEGLFEGFVRHKDGSSIGVLFQLKCIPLASDQSLFCMWVCRDLDRGRARNGETKPDPYWTDQVGVSPEVTDEVDGTQEPCMSSEEAQAVAGVYSSCYDTLRPVGKGAFGFVRLAQRKSDKQMVVVKFLRKSGVLQDCWVHDRDMGLVAQEISLLARLNHPNIVMLLEAYENERYFQLVMEKHGDGLDLFEFIERCPKMTEPLVSYMFRQMVAGLAYLHAKNILHRDVKDENIIMDRSFHVKLIDFGSAAFMEPGKLFHTFCGTLEYCSPEVLLGNSYPGPELEMWALGVTLYTLVFGENPFFDVEETISGHLQPPYLTTPGLMKVLLWLLHPDPKSRAKLKDLEKDKWTNQEVDILQFSFEAVLGYTNARPEDDRTLQSPKPHPHKDKPHPLSENIDDITHLLDTKLHLDSNCGYHGEKGD